MAASADHSGTCGDNLTWSYVEATHILTISGSGKMKSYSSIIRCPWFQYGDSIATVIIEEGVTTIGNAAFQDCSGITAASIPQSVTTIGNNSFLRCSKLASISIPGKVTTISQNPFAGCSSLTSISVEAGNTVYDSRDNCNCIIETKSNTLIAGCANSMIPQNIVTIGYAAFFGCTELTSITIPSGVISISNAAFTDCTGLISVTIPVSISAIGNGTFTGCKALTSINITVGDLAEFCNNQVAQSVYLNCAIPIKLLDSNGKEIKEYVIPNSVTSIGLYAFSGCGGLTSVIIPSSVTEINAFAFMDCTGLTSVTIPNSVTSIGKSVGEGNKNVFHGCSGLTSINVEDGNTVFDSRNNCNGIVETETNMLITGCQNTTIPTSVSSIGQNAFSGCTSMTTITIPPTVTSIFSSAFYQCSGLRIVNINDIGAWCNTSIGDSYANPLSYAKHLYSNGEEISDLVIPDGVTHINPNVFYGCSSLTSTTIPASVTTIGRNAFYGCRLENVLTKNSKATGGEAFSQRTYQHAMLYIPEGTWGDAIYDGDWYLFNNIRETVMKANDLSQSKIYTLMNTNTYGYAVYDETSGEVKMVKAFYSIDEQDVNNCWMVLTQDGRKYLYNVGAKKYATIVSDGSMMLTTNATPIEVTEGDNGLVLGADGSRQWAFVKNNSLTDITGIASVVSENMQSADIYYSIGGQRISSPQKGLNIIRMRDGATKKYVGK